MWLAFVILLLDFYQNISVGYDAFYELFSRKCHKRQTWSHTVTFKIDLVTDNYNKDWLGYNQSQFTQTSSHMVIVNIYLLTTLNINKVYHEHSLLTDVRLRMSLLTQTWSYTIMVKTDLVTKLDSHNENRLDHNRSQ